MNPPLSAPDRAADRPGSAYLLTRLRELICGIVAVLVAFPLLLGPAPAQADERDSTTTYTHFDGETVTYQAEVLVGEPIRITGTGWLAKPDLVDDGEEGSVIGFKFIDDSLGQLSRQFALDNPRLGEPISNDTVWDAVWADGDGSFTADLVWPDSSNATADPGWSSGDSFTVQLLSGTLYSDEAGVDPNLRPDVSRTVALRISVIDEATGTDPVAPSFTTMPQDITVDEGDDVTFDVAVAGDPVPSLHWESRAAGADQWVRIDSETTTQLSITAATAVLTGTQYRAVATNSEGAVASEPATLTVRPAPDESIRITRQPVDQSVSAGQPATLTAAASGTPAPSVQWQRSADDGVTWSDVRGATDTSYTIEPTTTEHNGWLFRAVFRNSANPDGMVSEAARLSVTPRQNTREICGQSYGPGDAHTGVEFCFRGPEKVLVGQDIVIEGTGGYLATDGLTGSVINFFLDAQYSGDPNTVYSKQNFTNPATGARVTDRRTHAIVQANSDGTWRATIKWPTISNASPSQDGSANYTQAELDAKFAPGTQHTIRMLTGSLLNNPVDRQRGASLVFTVVNSLDDEIGVTEPVYPHLTYTSDVPGDNAVAWIPSNVDSGVAFPITGTGWLTKDHSWGSRTIVRLQDETGAFYQRSGAAGQEHAVAADPTIWQVIQASETGDLDASVQLPAGLAAGDFLAVELSTVDDGTPLGDTERHWVSEPLSIDGRPYIPELGDDATCVAGPGAFSYELAPGMAVPAANIGGTIRLTGQNWCNLVGGGSLLAIKINAGGYQHPAGVSARHYDANLGREVGISPSGIAQSNKTIWYAIEAADDGSFDVEIPLPNRTNSIPAFTEGSYTLQILTRTLSADPYYAGSRPDPSRSVQTPEFTVVAEGVSLDNVKPGEPQAAPDPLHATEDLTQAGRGGVTVEQQATRWLVTVPGAAPGDWVYVNVFDDQSPRFPWGNQWFQVGADRRVILPISGIDLPPGRNKLSVQDRNGELLGWDLVTVTAPDSTGGSDQDADPAGSAQGGSGNRNPFVPTAASLQRLLVPTTASQPKPDIVPAAPVPGYDDLDATNAGDLTGELVEDTLIVRGPGLAPGQWLFLHLYTETGRIVPVDWVQVGSDATIRVAIGTLPDGSHKLTVLKPDGELVGWVGVDGPNPLESAVVPTSSEVTAVVEAEGSSDDAAAQPTTPDPGDNTNLTLILIGVAVLILAGSAAGIITLSAPVAPKG